MALLREPVPDGSLGQDNQPLTVLPENTILKRKYKTNYFKTGGMGIIYTATIPDKKLIIKEVDAARPKLVIALNQEKNTLERLDYEGIVKIYDFFEEEGYYYLVLEYVEGKTLTELIPGEDNIFISEKKAARWAIQICDIFDYLHNLNPPIIYRDLKPDNIIIDTFTDRVKLIDFGVAKVFKKGQESDGGHFGSVLTASPEHYGGSQTDCRSDIYTLGATLVYLLTNGKAITDEPFVFKSITSINKDVSEALVKVIKKAISLEPGDRFQIAREMKKALIETQPDLKDNDFMPKPIESPQELKKKKKEIITGKLLKMENKKDEKGHNLVISVAVLMIIIAIIIVILLGKNILFSDFPPMQPTRTPVPSQKDNSQKIFEFRDRSFFVEYVEQASIKKLVFQEKDTYFYSGNLSKKDYSYFI